MKGEKVSVFGRTIPTADGKAMWIGMHPYLFDKEKCAHTIKREISKMSKNKKKKAEATTSQLYGSKPAHLDKADKAFEESSYLQNDALSVAFHRIALMMEEADVIGDAPRVDAPHKESKSLLLLPGYLSTSLGSMRVGKLNILGEKDEDGNPKLKPVSWWFPIGKDEKTDKEIEVEPDTVTRFRRQYNSKFIYIQEYSEEYNAMIVRTSAWILEKGNIEQLMRAIIEGAYINVALMHSFGYTVNDNGTEPRIYLDDIELTEDTSGKEYVAFSVMWVSVRDRGCAVEHIVDAPYYQAVSKMIALKEALMKPDKEEMDEIIKMFGDVGV